jgi:hypothetical protein
MIAVLASNALQDTNVERDMAHESVPRRTERLPAMKDNILAQAMNLVKPGSPPDILDGKARGGAPGSKGTEEIGIASRQSYDDYEYHCVHQWRSKPQEHWTSSSHRAGKDFQFDRNR